MSLNTIFPFFRIETKDFVIMSKSYTKEDLGEIWCAMAAIFQGENDVVIKQELKYPVEQLKDSILTAFAAYENKCKMNAENGAKGGRAKAERKREKTKSKDGEKEEKETGSETIFSPPSKTEFKSICAGVLREYGYGGANIPLTLHDDEKIDLYEQLKQNGWHYETVPIETKEALRMAILLYSLDYEHDDDRRKRYYTIFETLVEYGEFTMERFKNYRYSFNTERKKWHDYREREYDSFQQLVEANYGKKQSQQAPVKDPQSNNDDFRWGQ